MYRIINETPEGESPMHRAREELQRRMIGDTTRVLYPITYGGMPELPSPLAWRSGQGPAAAREPPVDKEKPGNQKEQGQGASKKWQVVNPSLVKDWQLPAGKNFDKVYDHTDARKKSWATSWPKLPHHLSGQSQFSCP